MRSPSESLEVVCPFDCGWWCWGDQCETALRNHLKNDHVVTGHSEAWHRGYHQGWKEGREFERNTKLRFVASLRSWFTGR